VLSINNSVKLYKCLAPTLTMYWFLADTHLYADVCKFVWWKLTVVWCNSLVFTNFVANHVSKS